MGGGRTTVGSFSQHRGLDVLVAIGILLEDDLPGPIGRLHPTELEEDVGCTGYGKC